ncbi:hypothetical protein CH276_20250 [Rhodococcus sp. 06-470-2]|jgi:hypothetical protein|uniref:hypothetical protein n=1 Tax=unclassified Rhodococcus (in: high G+C Gram-positive bacteria) TaxID=192944 RepID=UPI000B9B71C8|nr:MULTISPECIES: hypothetical protein [unclassified Rhodococcus (in: high G+C Gram-positive bacteria)]OZC59486.1 hypothetical protein CH276_20250 [Rhodococcus sp. 06-470-2]OZE57185.1 hypothetical protein CH265_23945 [Rhodococcus sp. 05-2221-1B]
MYRPTVRSATLTWLAGTSAALVVQGVFPEKFATTTAWGSNPGWQREIAIWNLGTLVAAGAIVAGDGDPVRAQLRGLAVLSALFGVNHAVAAAQSGKPGNVTWAVINGAGVVSALATLAIDRPSRRSR